MIEKKILEKLKEVFGEKNIREYNEDLYYAWSDIIGKNILNEELYCYILNNYAHVFLKDNYKIKGTYRSSLAGIDGFEPFLYFCGLEGNDNVFDVYNMYKNQLPKNYFPIGLVDGGNLLCINNNSSNIYMWVHDNIDDNIFQIDKSLENIICKISIQEEVEFDLSRVKLTTTKEMDDAVKMWKNNKRKNK